MGALKGGITIGVYCRNAYTADRFMRENFNPPDRIKRTPTGMEYLYNDGDIVRWIRPYETSRGYKNNKVFVQEGVDREIIDTIIVPSVINREVEYFE